MQQRYHGRRLLTARHRWPRRRRAAKQRDELPSHHWGAPSSGLFRTLLHRCARKAAVHHSKNCVMLSQMGQERRIGAVRNISALPPRADVGADIVEPPVRSSRPGEFHPEPLTDPDLTLSRHPARAIARRLPPSIEYRVPPVAG
jgi:hypothetical protein